MAFGLDDALSLGGSLLSGFMNNSAAMDRQTQAQQFSAEQYASRYQTTVKDMEAAGLNPMLAYGQGAGTAPTSSAASSAGYSDFGATYNQSKMNSAQVANVEADTMNKRAQAELIQSQVALNNASADSARAGINVSDATFKKIVEETKNIPVEGKRIQEMVYLLRNQQNLFEEQGKTQQQTQAQLKALIGKIKSETSLLDLDVEAAKSLDNLGRTSKELKPIVDMLRVFLRR